MRISIEYGSNLHTTVIATWPFARLEIKGDTLLLSWKILFFHQAFALRKSDISNIIIQHNVLVAKIVIVHENSGCPPYLAIRAFKANGDLLFQSLQKWISA